MTGKRSGLARARKSAGYTQEQFAKALRVDRSTIIRWESGACEPLPYLRPKMARLLRLSNDRLDTLLTELSRHESGDATQQPASPPVLDDTGPAPDIQLDGDYVESLYVRIGQLVEMDIQFGGDQASEVALSLFESVRRKLGSCRCAPRVERDLYAAAGELGEVAGWLLYDAGRHDLVRLVNQEALHLSRLAGDHSMELLILQNMSMHAGHLGRPVEALRIARMVLANNTLSPRLEALFRTREARALAQGGDESTARRTYDRARSLYLDGTSDGDPAWAWWINDQELAWHEAMMRADSDDWRTASDAFQRSLELTPGREIRRRYNYLASLLDAQIRVSAWQDADHTIERVLPYIDEVGSTRTATILLGALDRLGRASAPPSVRDAAGQLTVVLGHAGYRP